MNEVLIFRLGSSEWALPAHKVRRVLSPRPLTRVPGAGPLVRGLVAWRAHVLPALALGEHLGCGGSLVGRNSQTPLLVVEVGGELVALVVDEVIRFASVQVGPSAAHDNDKSGRAAEQVEVEKEGCVVQLLDLERVLSGQWDGR